MPDDNGDLTEAEIDVMEKLTCGDGLSWHESKKLLREVRRLRLENKRLRNARVLPAVKATPFRITEE